MEYTFEKVFSYENILNAHKEARKGVSWKCSVQSFNKAELSKCAEIYNDLRNEKDIREGFYTFTISERGKTRIIQSLRYRERVIHKCFAKNCLNPLYHRSLIYDNYANQKGKGVSLAERRFTRLLREFVMKNGRNGYLLKIDLKNYFGEINHKIAKEQFAEKVQDTKLRNIFNSFVDAYGDKGLGLGSELSQAIGIYYPNKIDHYIKEVLKVRYYGRYMDDMFFIGKYKDELLRIFEIVRNKYKNLGISFNDKKTKLYPLEQGFSFLRTRYNITKTLKVIIRPPRKAIARERRKIKKLLEIAPNEVNEAYKSWRGNTTKRFMCYRSVVEIDKIIRRNTK